LLVPATSGCGLLACPGRVTGTCAGGDHLGAVNDAVPTTSRMLAAALAYAGAGLPVFPAVSGGKAPLTPHGFRDATTDPATITAWWMHWPKVNIAVPTGPWSGWDVLDIDVSPDGVHGLAELDESDLRDLEERRSHVVHTPSGGEHWYYPAGGCGNGSIPGMHLDYRGNGGYVLVPPSTVIYSDGTSGHYTQASPPRPPGAASAMDWPAVRARLIPPPPTPRPRSFALSSLQSADQRMEYLVRHVLAAPKGNRNNALFWSACRAVENGSTDLSPLATAAVHIGLTEEEAARTCASALRTPSHRSPASTIGRAEHPAAPVC
jgi:hypothetical protein